MFDLTTIQSTSSNPALVSVLYSSLMSFLLSGAIAYTYIKTFVGLSYSRNYVQALILGSIVASTVMMAIGDSLARGLGMMGALAIIRFRTSFKDPKDIIFIFGSLGAGISCGVGALMPAIIGTLVFICASVFLYNASFTSATYYDGMLRFSIGNSDETRNRLEKVLSSHCRTFALVTVRDMQQGRRLDYAYHVKLKKGKEKEDFITDLRTNIESLEGLSLMMQENTVEL